MSFKKNIKKQCLIVLSVLVFYPALVQADNSAKIPPNMRMSAGLHKRSDGSFCAIDPRGKSALTPSFVKPSLSAKPSMPKGVPVCTAKETKAFQEQAKRAYLQTQGGHIKKTSAGALLGSTLKGMGVGCVVVAGANLIVESMTALFRFAKNDDTLRTNNRESLTEAKGICVECAFFGAVGGMSGALQGRSSAKKAAYKTAQKIEADLHKEAVLSEEARLKGIVKNMSAKDIKNTLKIENNHLNRLKQQLANIDTSRPEYSRNRNIENYKAQRALSYKALAEADDLVQKRRIQQEKVKFWESMQKTEPGLSRQKIIHTAAVEQVGALEPWEIKKKIANLPDSTKEAIIKKHSKALHKFPGVTGFLSGAAGAVICHEGTVYVLNKEDPKI